MGFNNEKKPKIGKHAYEIGIYSDNQLVKVISTDDERSISLIEGIANEFISPLIKSEDYKIVKFYKSQ